MTRFACLAAVGALVLAAAPAELQGQKGKGKGAGKAVQRPSPRPAAPALTRPQGIGRPAAPTRGLAPSRPAARPNIPSRGFVPRAPQITRPTTPSIRPTAPTARPSTQLTRPTAPQVQPRTGLTRPTTPATRPGTGLARPTAPATRPGGITTRPDRPGAGLGGATGRPGAIDRTPGTLARPDRDRIDRDRPDRDRFDRDRRDRDPINRIDRDRLGGNRLDPDRFDRDRLDRDRLDRDRLGGTRLDPDRDRFDRDRFDRDRRDRPRTVIRPDIDRTTINRRNVNRTDIDIRNRSTNRNVTVNRWGGGGRQIGAPRSWYTQPGNWSRSWWGDRPAWYWGRPWYWHHTDWHHGYWNYWSRPPALWFGAGLLGWLLNPGDSFTYYNPYWVAPAYVPTYLDYSEPLPVVSTEVDVYALPPDPDALADPEAPPEPPSDATVAEAYRLLEEGRTAFRAGEYARAQAHVEVAIRLVPSDPALHEFRALTLFARGEYQEAAATLYAVLTAGPGWDWPTMRDLYPNVETYTAQLRALERFVAERPDAGYGHFVLAYHYLVTANRDAAVRELRETVRIQPDDKLAQALLTSLTTPEAAGAPGVPPAPGR